MLGGVALAPRGLGIESLVGWAPGARIDYDPRMSDDANFESIDHDEAPGVGPAAVLLCGFAEEETDAVGRLLAEAGAPGHAVIRMSEP